MKKNKILLPFLLILTFFFTSCIKEVKQSIPPEIANNPNHASYEFCMHINDGYYKAIEEEYRDTWLGNLTGIILIGDAVYNYAAILCYFFVLVWIVLIYIPYAHLILGFMFAAFTSTQKIENVNGQLQVVTHLGPGIPMHAVLSAGGNSYNNCYFTTRVWLVTIFMLLNYFLSFRWGSTISNSVTFIVYIILMIILSAVEATKIEDGEIPFHFKIIKPGFLIWFILSIAMLLGQAIWCMKLLEWI